MPQTVALFTPAVATICAARRSMWARKSRPNLIPPDHFHFTRLSPRSAQIIAIVKPYINESDLFFYIYRHVRCPPFFELKADLVDCG